MVVIPLYVSTNKTGVFALRIVPLDNRVVVWGGGGVVRVDCDGGVVRCGVVVGGSVVGGQVVVRGGGVAAAWGGAVERSAARIV